MKERLDLILVELRFVESRTKAQWLIRKGYVTVDGKVIKKPSKHIDNASEIKLKSKFPYVGRGGLKLEAALNYFNINVKDKVCVDIGASVGGFTDCLLKHGAKKVYAVDIAHNLLHPSLICDKMHNRVVPKLDVDARELTDLDIEIDICTIDVTFASLKTILPNTPNYLKDNGDIVALVKPLFETEFYELKKYEIIDDPQTLRQIIRELVEWSVEHKFYPYGLLKSPILGKGGSIEFFLYYRINKESVDFKLENRLNELL
ncbi:MAG: TlyA family rRNA (cytidine-2'-O)-methyltransferase [Candidatus Lokiarchaeota archaeon]|nr:TlyA family rRNA (cytidine-2'-O)-methyltransferase [Candidatus Lokiarchaeota archaeon]MBD3338462.1 TlyA family rRNA (cytidine-2'-O)-methyltransferase [Candidatus Lokiarchaeota archaeon]